MKTDPLLTKSTLSVSEWRRWLKRNRDLCPTPAALKRWLGYRLTWGTMLCKQWCIAFAAFALFAGHVGAATLRWDDTQNPPGTSYLVSNKVGTSWQLLAHTTNKTATVTLQPGTNTFSLTASNGLVSDPSVSSTNIPFKVINVIIEARSSFDQPWGIATNYPQVVFTTAPSGFYRTRIEFEE